VRRRVAASATALALLLSAAMPCVATTGGPGELAPAAPGALDELLHLLAERRHGHVSFTEVQVLAVLKHPVASTGELMYDAPDRLEKLTMTPRREDLVLSGSTLTIRRGSHTRALDLAQHPDIAPWVESVRATLAGDRATLERYFHIELSGDLAHWRLQLVPQASSATAAIASVRIEGSGAALHQLEISQADGDHSVMIIGAELSP
jgi:hypothetical protein